MGWFDDFVDAASDVASDIGSSIADAAEDVGSVAVDVAGSAGGYLGDAVGTVGSTVDTATGGLAGDLFNAVDNTVFDTVDYVTGGAINIDFDDGKFSASVGIPGIATAGASIGEDGITASSDTLLGSTDVGLTDDGFQFASSGGIDWGPLPYYDGHVNVSADGDISINGHVQGTVPTPYGILSGQATAGFESTDQGWGASLDANGTLTTESGVTIGAGVQAGYMESGGNSQTTFGLEGSVSEPGVGTVGGSFGYQSTTKDGVTVTTEHAEGHASGFGVTAQAGESYVGIDTPQGSASQFESGYDISGPTIDTLGQLGNSLLGDSGGITTPGAAGAAMGGTDPMAGGAMHSGAAPALGDDVLTGAGSGAVGGVETGGAGGAGAPAPGLGGDDDVLMGSAPSAPDMTAGAPDAAAGFGNPDPGSGGTDSWTPTQDGETAVPEAAAPEPAPAPDAFEQLVSSADQMQNDLNSMTDDLSTSGDE
jgi:hypothetical protein